MSDAHLRRLISEAVADVKSGNLGRAKWGAVFVGGELETLAHETGGAVAWPKEFEAEPLRGWAEWGAELRRRALAKPVAVLELDLRRPFGGNHAAHALGGEE